MVSNWPLQHHELLLAISMQYLIICVSNISNSFFWPFQSCDFLCASFIDVRLIVTLVVGNVCVGHVWSAQCRHHALQPGHCGDHIDALMNCNNFTCMCKHGCIHLFSTCMCTIFLVLPKIAPTIASIMSMPFIYKLFIQFHEDFAWFLVSAKVFEYYASQCLSHFTPYINIQAHATSKLQNLVRYPHHGTTEERGERVQTLWIPKLPHNARSKSRWPINKDSKCDVLNQNKLIFLFHITCFLLRDLTIIMFEVANMSNALYL